MAVGGWMGTPDEFETLASHWNTTLRRARVKAFHFVDFNHSIKEWEEAFLRDLFDVLGEISKRVSAEVIYVVDRQQEFHSSLRASFENLRALRPDYAPKMGGITFEPKTEFPQLQDADLLVGETAKSLQNRLYDPKRPVRKSFLAFLEMRKKLVGGYYDAKSIQEMVTKMRRRMATAAEN